MASYPGAVKTFTSKSDGAGNKVFASHINDLQDEVTAIEDGLLNGTAPVNSSRITAASLAVSGNSTITGSLAVGGSVSATGDLSGANLNISGNSTIGGGIQINGTIVKAGARSTVLSTGDTHNISGAGIYFLYVQTNSSGSTLTGINAIADGQVISIYNAGPSAVLGLKNSSGSVSTNQFSFASDTNIAVGAAATFYKSALVGKWVRV